MGKASTATTEMIKRKKRGRPAKVPITTPPNSFNYDSTPTTNHRSTRRTPSNFNSPPQPEFDDDDDDERKKKVKFVVRLLQADEKSKVNQNRRRHSPDYDSGSESDPEFEDRDMSAGDDGSDDGVPVQEKEEAKVTDSPLHGSPLDTDLTSPLPNKKLLVLILDKLQRKDKHGVFSEPVDPEELPDYFETIEQPMDFGTIRKKLERGVYKSLDELEHDVVLICSNAMQYNAPSSVYYRQARAIQELSKREFDNLKREVNDSEPQPKVVRRGRPPGNKNQNKLIETSPVDRVGPETSPGATLAIGEDKTTGYNLRKTPALNRFRSTDLFMASNRSRNGENYSEWLADWNDEFPASILRADMKHSKRWFTVDEKRRDTYRQFHHPSSRGNSPVLSSRIGDMKRLVPVGLQEPLVYARSLARYAANFGPVAWKFASKKIEIALPSGIQYGPGWVGDNGAPSHPLSFSTEKQKSSKSTFTPSTSDLSSAIANNPSEAMVEAVRKFNSLNEPFVKGEASSLRTPSPSQQKLPNQSHRETNPSQMMQSENWSLVQSGYPMEQVKGSASHREGGMWNFGKSTWPTLPMQQKYSFSVPPDLNVRVPVGSPRVKIGSPQQPDLALQL